jgi:hypothetical protein
MCQLSDQNRKVLLFARFNRRHSPKIIILFQNISPQKKSPSTSLQEEQIPNNNQTTTDAPKAGQPYYKTYQETLLIRPHFASKNQQHQEPHSSLACIPTPTLQVTALVL